MNEDGSLSGTPAETDEGINLFVVTVSDALGAIDSTTLQITVHPPHRLVSVAATSPDAAETGPINGVFTFTRSVLLTGDITVNFNLSGTADQRRGL